MSPLTARDFLTITILSAIWGSSFLFMRIAAPHFGPFFLIEMRVFSAFAVLLPVCLFRGQLLDIGRNWKPIFVIGVCNMAIPFTLLAYATLSITAGLASILNATVPFFTAIVGFLLFSRRLSVLAILGLIIGFAGVVVHALCAGPGPGLAGVVAVGVFVLIKEELLEQLLPVEEMGEGLTDVQTVERRLAHVEAVPAETIG